MLLQAADRDRWNDFVRASTYPSVMQSWEWGELKAATGWTPLVIALEGEGELQAGALLLERRIPHLRRGLLYAPRGPILDWSNTDLLARLVAEIRTVARQRAAVALKIDPCVPAERTDVAAALEGLGFRFVGSDDPDLGGTQPRYVMKTDLRPEPDELLASFHPKWRYNIRLAERKGVAVTDQATREDLPAWYEVLKITGRRDGFTVRALSYFYDLWDLIIAPGLGRLFLARVGEQLIAGTMAFCLPPQCWYVYGASSNEHRNLMPNHAL